MLIVTLVAVVIRLVGAQRMVPNFILSIASLLGGMTVPLLMLILGGNVYMDFNKKGLLQVKEVVKYIMIKNVVFPLVFLGIILLARPAYHIALIVLLQGAIPPVTAVPLVTEREGRNRALVNQFLVASFLVSLVSIPLMVSLFSMFFKAP